MIQLVEALLVFLFGHRSDGLKHGYELWVGTQDIDHAFILVDPARFRDHLSIDKDKLERKMGEFKIIHSHRALGRFYIGTDLRAGVNAPRGHIKVIGVVDANPYYI